MVPFVVSSSAVNCSPFEVHLLTPKRQRQHHSLATLHEESDETELTESTATKECEEQSNKPLPKPVVKQVHFDTVTIRHFDIILGDNPACTAGPPLALGLHRNNEDVEIRVGCFEAMREGRRCKTSDLRLSSSKRFFIISESGIEDTDVERVLQEMRRVRKQRRQSISAMHIVWIQLKKKTKRAVSITKRAS